MFAVLDKHGPGGPLPAHMHPPLHGGLLFR